ncbi:hypothetical protein TraAM80_04199 [Trypanosoma rangeli]|uniref:Uncharacterized protein n=1 Tax=Trypanosoma rangeli TaxID=5698 RepID=A0A3R7MP88_TRYRA|nr:uncharacterized protein TraAM80_04199 [Trypanosoma rangeli]RNF06045.1 hypothetical protein TraAM80_04199 [Trypanosoma rangeli]|eukprot:RNF06045.1 hypothetical protein TraAM80_04199 [Trypanosoma rangeli]
MSLSLGPGPQVAPAVRAIPLRHPHAMVGLVEQVTWRSLPFIMRVSLLMPPSPRCAAPRRFAQVPGGQRGRASVGGSWRTCGAAALATAAAAATCGTCAGRRLITRRGGTRRSHLSTCFRFSAYWSGTRGGAPLHTARGRPTTRHRRPAGER